MRTLVLIPAVAVTLLVTGCLGVLPHDARTEAVAAAPREALALPRRNSRPYWLLRSQDGWVSGFEIGYGGEPEDDGVAVVQVARFRDAAAAQRAFQRLTPDYLYLLLRDGMVSPPRPFDYPASLPGDEAAADLYSVRPPPDDPTPILGQLTSMRAGAVIVLVNSIGVDPARLVPALAALSDAARVLPAVPS